MKKLLIALSFLAAQAIAGPNDLLIQQRNSTDTGNILRVLPCSTTPCVLHYDTTSLLPSQINIGAGLSVVSGELRGFSGAYSDLTGAPTNVSAFTNDSGYATSSSVSAGLAGKFDNPIGTTAQYVRGDGSLATFPSTGTVTSITAGTGLSGGTITTSGTISLPNTGTAGTYSGITTDAQGRVTAGTNRSFNHTTRSLNSCFQVSSTRDALVTYAVDISTTSTLASGQVGTVYLRTYTNSGCSTGTQEITRFVNGNTQTLGLSVTMTQNVTGTLTGVVAGGLWAQLVTENTTGSPSFTARPGQEVLF